MSSSNCLAATVFAVVALLVPAAHSGAAAQAQPVLPAGDDAANALVLQQDGKIVAAGESRRKLALARYKPNGSLDTSFGGDGRVTTGFGPAFALVEQPDGKLVVAGAGSNDDFALARYNPDGSPDRSFGVGGKVTTVFGSEDSKPFALVLQPHGKLVAGGRADGDFPEFALARYNPNGSLDTSFGTGGKVTTALGPEDDEVRALALQPDGKLVASGESDNSSAYDFALARYNPDGSLDTSFGTGGMVTTAFSEGDAEAGALVLQPDGKLVAAGAVLSDNDYFALARYNADGSPDPSFGTGGKVTTQLGPEFNAANALVLEPDGKLVAAGQSTDLSNNYFALARYNPNGTLDTSFDDTGKVTTKIRSRGNGAAAVVLQPDGKLVAAGFTLKGSTQQNRLSADFALLRYNPSGSLDGSFGRGGTITTAFRCVVPKVEGWKLSVAKLAIRREDCSIGKVSRAFSARVKSGQVISQRPKPGAERQPGSKVELEVSKGRKG